MAKKPEPIKMEFNCSITYDYLLGPESYPKLKVELVTSTAYNGRILLDTACADIVGDLNRLDLSGRRAAKVTVELPTLTDEEMAERKTRAKARHEIYKLKSEIRSLQDKVDRLEKKYQ